MIFCLYSLGITRIIIGIFRHKPVGYLAYLSLLVSIYFLWLITRNMNRNIINNIATKIIGVIAIPLLIIGWKGAPGLFGITFVIAARSIFRFWKKC